jgi:hypothetical protein
MIIIDEEPSSKTYPILAKMQRFLRPWADLGRRKPSGGSIETTGGTEYAASENPRVSNDQENLKGQ